LSIPIGRKRNKRIKPLPYWNKDCKKALRDRNKARNATHKNKTLDNCINYTRSKGKALHVIKSSARDYWKNYCSTLNNSTKLSTVWRLAQRMNGINKEHKIKNLQVNGSTLENNEDKAAAFADCFSDIGSNINYSSSFLARKDSIELNHTSLLVC